MPRLNHSPIRIADGTPGYDHSSVRTTNKTWRCDHSSKVNSHNTRSYSPQLIENTNRSRVPSPSPASRVIKTHKDVWFTRTMASQAGLNNYLGISLRETIVYCLFLLCLTIVALDMLSIWMYWYKHMMHDLFVKNPFPGNYHIMKTFPEIIHTTDFWQYTRIVLGRNLWYDIYPDDVLDVFLTPDKLNMVNILFENRLVGLPRMRQLQVKNGTCDIQSDLADLFEGSCYGAFSDVNEKKTSFGLRSGSAWTYHKFDSIWDPDDFEGRVASYPYAGFYSDLSPSYEDFIVQVEDLISNQWITRATRVVFVDFVTFNANVNLFCFVKLIFEFPPVGGIIPSHNIETFKLLRYVQTHDYLIVLVELCLFLFLFYFTWEELHEWRAVRRTGNFWSLWTCIDLVIILLGWLFFLLYIYRLILAELLLPRLLSTRHHYPQFYLLLSVERFCRTLLLVLLMVSWFKLIKYLNISRYSSRVYVTVSLALAYLMSGVLLFITILIGFSICAHLLFGASRPGFYSLLDSITTILRCMWGSCFELSYEIDIMTTIFLLIFSLVAYIFLGFLLALVLDAYSTAKNQPRAYDNYSLYFRRQWRKLVAHLRREPALVPTLMNRDDIVELLRRHNFSRHHVDLFLRKNSIRTHTLLETAEVGSLIANMKNEDAMSHQIISNPCVEMLEQRILCSVERNLSLSIAGRINHLISRIEHVEDRLNIQNNRYS